MLKGLLLSLALCAGVHAHANANLEIGYNEAWIGQKYQTYLTSEFDAAEVTRVFTISKASGGNIVRLWSFKIARV